MNSPRSKRRALRPTAATVAVWVCFCTTWIGLSARACGRETADSHDRDVSLSGQALRWVGKTAPWDNPRTKATGCPG